MSQLPPVLIRADCGQQMGAGHVMRCLALAQAWQDVGVRVIYALASYSAAMVERLRCENIEIVHLPCEPGSLQDAFATIEAVQSFGSDWIVVDGYQFDENYHASIKMAGLKLVVVDDFGKWNHCVADIVVNQIPFTDERLYVHRESYTRLLLGTDYTFLRREFLQHARPRLKVPEFARRLLLTFGGSDPDQLTEMALMELKSVAIDGLEAVVLIGPGNPRWPQLNAVVEGLANVRLLRNPPDILDWMAWSDLAVVAAGSTLWELAYFRVPCITLLVDEQQSASMEILQRRGACFSPGVGRNLPPGQLAHSISMLARDPRRRADLGTNLAAMVDGHGAQRVRAAMLTVEANAG